MKKMKRFMSLFFAVVLTLSLAACGKQPTSESPSSTPSESAEQAPPSRS